MYLTSDANILVTIPNATLTSSSSGTFTGPLALEYVTFDIPSGTTATRDVLLVLRIGAGTGAFEAPLDPARALTVSTSATASHRYVFHATRDDAEFSVEFPATGETADDVELFHSVLVGYAADVQDQDGAEAAAGGAGPSRTDEKDDLRGRFVLVNEDNGEIVGALDRSVRVYEDPSLGERGHEDDPVVVELPEGGDAFDELRDVEVIVRTIPPEDRDWILKGAIFVRYGSFPFPFHLPPPADRNVRNPAAMPSRALPPSSRAR
jgi:spartin